MRSVGFLFSLLLFCLQSILGKGDPTDSNQDSLLLTEILRRAASLTQDDPDSALSVLESGKIVANPDLNSTPLAARFYLLMGQAQFEKGFYTLALKNYFTSLSIFNDYQMGAEEALLNLKIGYTHLNLSEPAKAEEFYLKSLDYYHKSNESTGITDVYNRLGVLYAQKKDSSKAFYYLFKARKLDEQSGDSLLLARSLNNIGHVYNLFNYPSRALSFLHSSIQLKEKHGASDNSLCPTLNNLGIAYLRGNEPEKALEYSLKSLSIAEKYKLLNRKKEALENISHIYTKLKDYKKALHYSELFHQAHSELISKENYRKNIEIEMQYEGELLARKNQNENDLLMERLRAEYTFILALLFSCLMVIALLGKFNINGKYYRGVTFLALLLFFESIMIINDRLFDEYMNNEPLWALSINFSIALLFVPIHGFLQKKLSKVIPDNILKPIKAPKLWTSSRQVEK